MNDTNTMCRQMTQEEVRDAFLGRIWRLIRYWENLKDPDCSRVEGVVHSILAMLDGCQCDMPGFEIYPSPHPNDKEHYKANEENWWPDLDDKVSVHGNSLLHEEFYPVGQTHKEG